MKKYMVLVAAMMIAGMVSAQEIEGFESAEIADTLIVNVDTVELDPDPEWYVAPEIPASKRAPQHAQKRATAATGCVVDSILTFNVDSVLVSVSTYDYDNAGRTIRTTVWTVNPDGSRYGSSKQEYGFNAAGKQVMTADYIWDNTTNDWKGTEKTEFVYNDAGKMETKTAYDWMNGEWSAKTKYTYSYDGANRETEYYAYERNANNQLVYTNARIQTWYDNTKRTLEILYTAYDGTNWSAGTKTVWDYDGSGNQTLYEYYSSLSGGQWIGSAKEVTEYASGNQTLHATYTWANGDWVGSTKEVWTYGANGITLHEYYSSYSNNAWIGSAKEVTEYTSGKKTGYTTYTWGNGDWVGATKEVWEYTSGKETLHEYYPSYSNGAWVGQSKEVTEYTSGQKTLYVTYTWGDGDWLNATKEVWAYASNKETLHEYYPSYSNGAWVGQNKEVTEYTSGQKTLYVTYTWANGDWVGVTKEVWGYTSGKQTLYETYAPAGNDWTITTRDKQGYDAAGNINLVETYTFPGGVETGTQKEEYVFNSAKIKIEIVVYAWTGTEWVKYTKAEANYQGSNQTLDAHYVWSNGAWVGTGTRTEKTFTNGKESLVLTYSWDLEAAQWVYATRRVIVRNGDGKLVGDTTYQYINAEWVNYARETHGYDAWGNDTLGVKATWNGTEWVPTSIDKGTFSYTAAGNPLLVETYTGLEDAWTGQTKRVYTYETYNNVEKQTSYWEYEWKSGKWVDKSKILKTYNSNGNIILDESYNKSGSTWVGSYKYEYLWESGKQVMEAQYKWDKNKKKWKGFSRNDQTYDELGNITSSTSYDWDTQKWDWAGSIMEVNVYEGKNRVEYVLKIWGGTGWENSSRKTYGYDLHVYTHQYRWRNNNWLMTSCEDQYYDGDAEGKLRREINGSWSNSGVLQSYYDNLYYYSVDLLSYNISFKDYNGTELASIVVERNQIPEYPTTAPTPSRESTAEWTYTFAGWDKELVPATVATTYTATYDSVRNTYTITWLNNDGAEIDHSNLEYGATPTHDDAVKTNTAEWTYTFVGWTPAITSVTGDATYKAQIDSVRNSYRITWLNADEVEVDVDSLAYGATPSHEDLVKTNTAEWTYTFVGWTPAITSVTADATYKAQIDSVRNRYRVTWLDADDTELAVDSLAYGATPSHEYVLKANTAEWTYSFVGWTPEIVAVTGDATYKAQIDSVRNRYRIIWLDANDTEIAVDSLAYGATPSREYVLKANTTEWTYSFVGWTPEIATVTGDATYKAQIDSVRNRYRITWLDADDTEIAVDSLAYGATPSREYVLKANTAEWTYSFVGWTPEIAAVSADATYKAQIDSVRNSYRITFKNGEDTLQSTLVAYGTMPVYGGETPTKQADVQYSYTFNGWDAELVAVTGETTYNATFSSTIKNYTITWLLDDGTKIDEESVAYGTTPSHTDAHKDNTAQYTITFVGWDKAFAAVTGDETYTAIFDSVVNSYTVIFYFEDGVTVLDSKEWKYGEMPSTSLIPSLPATPKYTYTFAGWSPELQPVTGNAAYTPVFDSIVNTYTVTFVNYNNMVLQSSQVPYDDVPEYTGETPTKPSSYKYHYVFAGWTPELVAVTGDARYKAVFEQVLNSYTILFYDEDGLTILDSVEVDYGEMPETSVIPTKEDDEEYTYTFAGWSPKIVTATRNTSYTATYTATRKTEGLWDVEAAEKAQKLMIDGVIYIRRGGKIYTLEGTEVE